MGDERPSSGTPERVPLHRQAVTLPLLVRLYLPMGVGIGAGRIAGDAAREPLGWWGSLGVGMAAAVAAALVAFWAVATWQRGGGRAEPGAAVDPPKAAGH